MKRERGEKLVKLANSPSKRSVKRNKVISGKVASKFGFLSDQAQKQKENALLLLEWKKQWNIFLIHYLNGLVNTEDNPIDLLVEHRWLKNKINAFLALANTGIDESSSSISTSISIQQCVSFNPNMLLKPEDLKGLSSLLKRIKFCDQFILRNYQILSLLLSHCDKVLQEFLSNPKYHEYEEICHELEKKILPALDKHLAILLQWPEIFDKKIKSIKSSPLKPYLTAILLDRKESIMLQWEKMNVPRGLIADYIGEIKYNLKHACDYAAIMVDLAAQVVALECDNTGAMVDLAARIIPETESTDLFQSVCMPGSH